MPMIKRRLNLFTIAFAIFWIVYTLILIFLLIQLSKLIPAEGELIAAKASYQKTLGWQTYRPPHWQLDVVYTYHFNGVLYHGSRLRIDGNGTVLESIAARKADEMMSANKKITVWINPNHPKFSVLEPKIGLLAWLFWSFLIAVTWLIHHFSPRVTLEAR